MYEWARPRYAVPVHGETRHLEEHAEFALTLGVEVHRAAQWRSHSPRAGRAGGDRRSPFGPPAARWRHAASGRLVADARAAQARL
ncbi:MAG: MBL fold metallo-hydrolase RNA specificity domain-containing protein [Parvularculaceae bacterium]